MILLKPQSFVVALQLLQFLCGRRGGRSLASGLNGLLIAKAVQLSVAFSEVQPSCVQVTVRFIKVSHQLADLALVLGQLPLHLNTCTCT